MNRLLATHDGEARRTDPRSFIVRTVTGLRNAVFPMVAGFFAMRETSFVFAYGAIAVALMFAISGVLSYLGWRKFTYRVGVEDIRVESGIMSRSARSVPYERIQDVSLEQKLLPRLFGLVEVKFETGAGGKDEMALTYLSMAEGERLRELVRERREGHVDRGKVEDAASLAADGDAGPIEPSAHENAELLFAMGPRRLLIFGLFNFSLAIVAFLFGATQQFDFLLPFDIWDWREWAHQLEGPGAWLAALGPIAQLVGAGLAVLSLLLVGFATGIIQTFTRDWGFMLEKTSRGFRRRRGMFTRTDVVMPVHRVQAVRIGTRFLRYRFGWHGLKFVSLAQDAGSSSHIVAPFARLEEIEPVIRAAGFHPSDGSTDWHRASKRYRDDGALLRAALFVIPTIATLIAAPPLAVIPLGLGAFFVGAHLYGWQFHRHAFDAQQVFSAKGFLSPATQIASRVKLQSVEIAQGPIAQRRGYATVHLGLAGGTFSMPGVAIEQAKALREAVLRSISGTDFSKLS